MIRGVGRAGGEVDVGVKRESLLRASECVCWVRNVHEVPGAAGLRVLRLKGGIGMPVTACISSLSCLIVPIMIPVFAEALFLPCETSAALSYPIQTERV